MAMPYNTQTLLEQELSKTDKNIVGWPFKLLSFALIVFALVGGLYLGLEYGFKGIYLSSKMKAVDNKLNSIEFRGEQKNNLINFYSQIYNINDILSSRKIASKYVEILEKSTIKEISYDNININSANKKFTIEVRGKANTFGTVAQQVELYKKIEGVKNVSFSSLSSEVKNNATVVSFSIYIDF